MRDDLCVFILSHQRAGRVLTTKTLQKAGYTGDWFIVVDDKDPQLAAYREEYGERLLVFSKDEYEPRIDLGDNFEGQQTPLYAREAVWDMAEERGYDWFFVLDDDYDWFRFRYLADGSFARPAPWVRDLDAVLAAMMKYMERTEILTLCFSQGGDWIGGENSGSAGIRIKRKAMNAFLCKTDRRFRYIGRFNDDVNTHVVLGLRGGLFFTYMPTQLNQMDTQSRGGGITEAYREHGTYVKSFYTVMMAPSCTKVTGMGDTRMRLHHRISWNKAVPKILPERYRKA